MRRIETTLSETEHKAWHTFCQETGKNSAKMLREFIKHSIENNAVDAFNFTEKHPIKTLKSKKITVSFTQGEFDKIIEKVALEGYKNPTNWVRCLIMNMLYQEAVLTDKEIDALEKLSYQLWAIGHNLNQVTTALNIDYRDSNKLKIEMIQTLKNLNHETRDAFSALIVKNKSRWYKRDNHRNKSS